MNLFKKVIVILILFGAIGIVFLKWYAAEHSMDEAQPFEINAKSLDHKVLIATQGSVFKDSVVISVIKQLEVLPAYIKVIDVSQLPEMNENDWSAIVILHTWENFSPQKDAKRFVDRANDKSKIIVVSTSGSGDAMIQGVDGITSASLIEEIAAKSEVIVDRVKLILKMP